MTKQLDMALSNDSIAEWYTQDFMRKLGLQENASPPRERERDEARRRNAALDGRNRDEAANPDHRRRAADAQATCSPASFGERTPYGVTTESNALEVPGILDRTAVRPDHHRPGHARPGRHADPQARSRETAIRGGGDHHGFRLPGLGPRGRLGAGLRLPDQAVPQEPDRRYRRAGHGVAAAQAGGTAVGGRLRARALPGRRARFRRGVPAPAGRPRRRRRRRMPRAGPGLAAGSRLAR